MAIIKIESEVKLTAQDIEYALSKHFNPRINTIVPNVSWGLGLNYEIDLFVVSPARYGTEIEIKISSSDIKADLSKSNFAHRSKLVKYFYYAVPEYLKDCKHLPLDCGLLVVSSSHNVKCVRPPRLNKDARKLSESEIIKLNSLAAMRIWNLKREILRLNNNNKFLRNKLTKE